MNASRMTSQSHLKTEVEPSHHSAMISPKGSVRDYKSHISNFQADDQMSSHTMAPQRREESVRGGSVAPSHHTVVGNKEPSHHS